MANQKALLTTREDFESSELASVRERSYLYFDGVNLPNDIAIDGGTLPDVIEWKNAANKAVVDGIIGTGNATKLNGGALVWRGWQIPVIERFSYSSWFKPTAADISATWRILMTNRGLGLANYGFHVALYKGEINIRIYSDTNAGGADIYVPNVRLTPDTWYHIGLAHNSSAAGNNTFVVLNGQIVHSFRVPTVYTSVKEHAFTLGDMLTGTGGAAAYPSTITFGETSVAFNENSYTSYEIIDLYEDIALGNRIDYTTEPGSIRQAVNPQGGYAPQVTFTSKVVDMGTNFTDYGIIQAKGTIPEGTSILIETRGSADGVEFDNWVAVAEDGTIQSANERNIQFRITFFSDGTATAILDEIGIFEEKIPEPPPEEIPLPIRLVGNTEPLVLYQDLSSGLKSLGQLRNAYDIIIEEEVNGEDTLTFSLPLKDKKAAEIGSEPVELLAVIGDRYYIVKENIRKRDADGKIYTSFICEARWTELRDWYCDTIEMVEATAKEVLDYIVANIFREPDDPFFDWTIGNVEITRRRTIRSEWSDVLSLLHAVQAEWGGELLFDTKNKVIHLVNQVGRHSGVTFRYDKNIKTMERTIDTYDLITRIYPTGKGELDITTVNNGVKFIENTEWVDKLGLRRRFIPYRWKDDRYTVPQNLYDDAKKLLDEMSKPQIKYKASIMDLSFVRGHEHEAVELGDTVVVEDSELFDERVVNRVLRRKYDVRNPENTEVEISQVAKTLADISKRALDDAITELIDSDPLSNTDIQQMTVFNHLLNSRAEDGFASWVEAADGAQFKVANAGFSGNWSFMVTPDFNKSGSITQTVDGVSHRSTYTVSAAVATEGKITRGSSNDAFIGIKVLVYYEGEDEPEAHYLGIPDITAKEPEEGEEEIIEE